MIADYHTHTSFSDDSKQDMEESILEAIRLGIDELCFTEHHDYLVEKPSHLTDLPRYHQTLSQFKEKYKHQIRLKFGAEFGMQRHTINDYRADIACYPFDFILLSSHQIDDLEFWINEYQEGKTQYEYNHGYYQAILDVITEYKDYSVLGHLDVIKRYDRQGILDDKELEEIIKKVLRQVIEDDKGIEVNTSSYRYNLPDLTPSRQILTWYRELGGKILTLGSDSHKKDDLAEHFDKVTEILLDLGFESFCTYDKMIPTFHRLTPVEKESGLKSLEIVLE